MNAPQTLDQLRGARAAPEHELPPFLTSGRDKPAPSAFRALGDFPPHGTPGADVTHGVTHLPADAKERKATPIFTGFVLYFPKAMAEVARVSKAGNDQHNPGEPLHWDKSKSTDHGDCILRHQIDAGTLDTDGHRHSAKVAWRAMAQLEVELDAEVQS